MKLKTHKGMRKRIKITGAGKFTHKTAGQDHFNSRESGKVTTNKRRGRTIAKVDQRMVQKLTSNG